MITILLEKILTALTGLLTGLKTKLEIINEALDIPVIVKTVTGAVCNFTANISRRCYSVKTTISASGGGGTPSEPVSIVGVDSLNVYQSGADTTQYIETQIEFDDTYYGGEIDIISGKLKLTHQIITLDGSESDSIYNITAATGYTRLEYRPYREIGIENTSFISDKLVNTQNILYGIWNSTSPRMFLGLPDTVTTVTEAKTWLSENNITIVYEAANPVEIDISPININPEIGENNIWFDSGNDTTVIYYEKLEV